VTSGRELVTSGKELVTSGRELVTSGKEHDEARAVQVEVSNV